MDRLRQIFDYTRVHLGQLSPTQKLLIGSTVIIMAMTLFIVNQYAGRSDMMTLGISAEDAPEAVIFLRRAGIRVQAVGTDVLVPAEDYLEAVTGLTQTGSLGSDALQNLIESIQAQPWWAPTAQNQQAMSAVMSQTLSTIVSGWSYVTKATVIVQTPAQRSMIGKRASVTKASATVKTKGSAALTDEQVRGIAEFIAGAVANLNPENVIVHDASTGRSRRVKGVAEFNASDYSELKTRVENDYSVKIYDLLQSIPGVVVVVNATVDIAQVKTFRRDYKKENDGSVALLEREQSNSIEETNSSVGGVAGVQSNTGTSIQPARAGQSTGRTISDSSTDFDPKIGWEEQSGFDPKGYATMVRAAINVPRSHYLRIWEAQQPAPEGGATTPAPPTNADLEEIMSAEESKIKLLVNQVIDTSSISDRTAGGSGGDTDSGRNDEVTVQMYYDELIHPAGGSGMPSQGAGLGSGILSFVGGGSLADSVKTIAVTMLGLVSLFLMFRLIRGSTTKRSLPTAEELVGIPPSLEAEDEDLIGMAAGLEPAMDALELDEEELRSRNLLEQVQEMVESSPNDAARLLVRWSTDD